MVFVCRGHAVKSTLLSVDCGFGHAGIGVVSLLVAVGC
jgi:hypothetical protein